MRKTAGLAAALATVASMAGAQDVQSSAESIQTTKDLLAGCTEFSTMETQRTCMQTIALETKQSADDYMNGAVGNVNFLLQGAIQKTLNDACSMSAGDVVNLQSDSIQTVRDTMNVYVTECISRQIDIQKGETFSAIGDFSLDLSAVPFDGNRLNIINQFQTGAVGLTTDNLSTEQKARVMTVTQNLAPAFTQ